MAPGGGRRGRQDLATRWQEGAGGREIRLQRNGPTHIVTPQRMHLPYFTHSNAMCGSRMLSRCITPTRVMSNFDFLRNDDEIKEGSYASVPTKRFCALLNVVSATAGGKEHLLPNIGNTETLLFCHFVCNEFFKIT